MQYKYLSKKGFTLVELIVVMAILGILSAITVVSVTGYLNKAKLSSDKTDLKMMNNQIEYYKLDPNYKEPVSVYEIRSMIDKLSNGRFTFTPRTANLGNHYVYNNESHQLELVSEDEWGKIIKMNNLNEGSMNTNSKSIRPNSIEAFAYTKDSPYILLDTKGSKLADYINAAYNATNLDDLQGVINNISNSKLNEFLKNELKTQLEYSVLISDDIVYKSFDDAKDKHVNVIFSKARNSTKVDDSALVGIPLSVIDIPEGITRIGTSAFADTGIKHVTLPSSINSISPGAFNNKDKTTIVLNKNDDLETLESILMDAPFIAASGSTIVTNNYSLEVKDNHISSSIGKNINFNPNIGEPLLKYQNKLKTLNLLENSELLDNKESFDKVINDYQKLATWEKNYINSDAEFKADYDYFSNTTYPLFSDYLNEATRLYELVKDSSLVLNNVVSGDEYSDLLSYFPSNFLLSDLISIKKKDVSKQSVSLSNNFGYYYLDNPGIEDLVIKFKGIEESKEVKIYSEGIFGLSISKSIKPNESLAMEAMARFGNQNSFPIVIGLNYVVKDSFTNTAELLNKFNINYKLYKYINNESSVVFNEDLVTRDDIFVDASGKHYYIIDLLVNDIDADYYRLEANFRDYTANIEFKIIEGINVSTGADLKSQAAVQNKNIILANNLTITTEGTDNEYWIDENGLLTYRSNNAFASSESSDNVNFKINTNSTLLGNNYTIDGVGMNGKHKTSSSDKKFIRLEDNASINNVNVVMDKIPEYDPDGSKYTFSQVSAVLYTVGSANIENVHIDGGLRGVRILNKNGKTVTINNSFFEGAMSNIEIYASSSAPTAKAYVKLNNVNIRTANSAAIDNGGHGVAIMWFPGSEGAGGQKFPNIEFSETNTRIFSWLNKAEAITAIKGALKGAGASMSDSKINAVIANSIFTYQGEEYVCTGMLIPFVTILKNRPKVSEIVVNSDIFNTYTEVKDTLGEVIAYFTKYVKDDQMFIDYISDTWGTVDGEKWNGKLDHTSNLKPIEEANQYVHHGLYKEMV